MYMTSYDTSENIRNIVYLKHHLVATSLTGLGDKPEITGLDLSPGEELDLLNQWLGRVLNAGS